MKKIYFIVLIFLAAISIPMFYVEKAIITYEIKEDSNIKEDKVKFYLIEYETNNLKEVLVSMDNIEINDIINYYTILQNRLPSGYTSPIINNVNLIDVEKKENDLYLNFDEYFYLSNDTEIATYSLKKTFLSLGFTNVYIKINNKYL